MIGVFVVFSRIFLLGILIFKGLTARRLFKLFGVKGLRGAVATLILQKPTNLVALKYQCMFRTVGVVTRAWLM
jgi:hypothetical protein